MSPTRLSRPGIYLFRPPGLHSTTLDRETLILFSVRFPKVVGAVLYHHREGSSSKSAVDLLETLLIRMQGELDIEPKQIRVKIFGMRRPQLPIMRAITSWLHGKGLQIAVCDTGKGVQRKILVDAENGLAGVTYAPVDSPFFLAKGTARERKGFLEETQTKVLVVTPNRMKGSLAKASLEELPGWKATLAKSFEEAAARPVDWDLILLVDGVAWTDKWAAWLEAVAKNYPKTRFGWSGDRNPTVAPVPLQNFPAINDKTIPAFKAALVEVAAHPLAWPAAGTLAFRRFRKQS